MVLQHLQLGFHFVRFVTLLAVLLWKNVYLLLPQIPTLRTDSGRAKLSMSSKSLSTSD